MRKYTKPNVPMRTQTIEVKYCNLETIIEKATEVKEEFGVQFNEMYLEVEEEYDNYNCYLYFQRPLNEKEIAEQTALKKKLDAETRSRDLEQLAALKAKYEKA